MAEPADDQPGPQSRRLDETKPESRLDETADMPEVTAPPTGDSPGTAEQPSGAGKGIAGDFVPRIEGFELIDLLGQGGMGVVWRAVQISTKRQVAIKLLSSASFGSKRALQRFEREVELSASLSHPNIARVYESGVNQGIYYYAMELIDGVPLDEYVRAGGLNHRAIVKLFASVCSAVQAAHQRGVIHRDLKPANILVDRQGEPHVLDFGLAKGLDSASVNRTLEEQQVAGTPAYMSPEQASGHLAQADTRSDVYSLGKILYFLLCGQPAHDLSGSTICVINRVAGEEIIRPRSH